MQTPRPTTQTPRYRPVTFGVRRVNVRDGAAGGRFCGGGRPYRGGAEPLQSYAERITDRFMHWAETVPDRSFMARREQLPDGSTGDWQHLSYARALQDARRIGQALLDRGLDAERPVMILSENSLEHAQLA